MDIIEIKNIIKSKYKILKDTNRETVILINGHTLRFIKDAHKYIVDGYETISVTQLIKRTNPDLYKDVPKEYLDIAARRGKALHDSIEYYETSGVEGFSNEFRHYLELKKKLELTSIVNELFILICNNKNEPICAGRLDMLYLNKDKKLGIVDFKRTVELYLDNVTLQLNLYRYGFIQTYGVNIDELLVMRLRDDLKESTYIKVDNTLAETAMIAYI